MLRQEAFRDRRELKLAWSKAGKGTTEKRARVFCLRVEVFFCLDFFGYFGSSQK
jgi:hypothetical protein